MTSSKVLLFGLNNTLDVAQAERLADQLPYEMTQATPKVNFSPAWVLRRVKGNVDIARFAVQNCSDPNTLALIAAREKRITVINALASNKYLSDEAYEALLTRLTPAHLYVVSKHRARTAAEERTAEEKFADFLSADNFRGIPNSSVYVFAAAYDTLLGLTDEIEDAAEQFLTKSALYGKWGMIANYLGYCHGLYQPNADLWQHVSWSPQAALAQLDGPGRTQALTWLLNKLVSYDDYADDEPLNPVDVSVMEMAISHIDPSMLNLDQAVPPLKRLVSEAAVDLLIKHDEWFEFLTKCLVNNRQFERLLRHHTGQDTVAMYAMLQSERPRLERLLDLAEDSLQLDEDAAASALSVLTDKNDPLIERIISLGNANVRVSYLTGYYTVANEIVLCDPKDVPRHLSLLGDENVQNLYTWAANNLYWFDEDYTNALVEYVPGLARHAAQYNSHLAPAYVHDRLVSTGADLLLCLDQLDRAETVSLNKLCSTLAILAQQS